MNRMLEIRERIAHYGLELYGHDRAARDRARDDLEVHAYSDMRYLLDEKQRLESELAAMTRRAEAAEQSARYERGTKEAFYIKYLVENKKTFKLDVHLQKARGQRDALKAERDNLQSENDALVRARQFYEVERDAAQRRAEAAEAALAIRKHSVLTPIYTCGGHGYEDDDDEDFWCPVCHAHLGTHHGYKTECPRCGQTINGDGEPIYHYRDMLRSEEEWRGPDAQGGSDAAQP